MLHSNSHCIARCGMRERNRKGTFWFRFYCITIRIVASYVRTWLIFILFSFLTIRCLPACLILLVILNLVGYRIRKMCTQHKTRNTTKAKAKQGEAKLRMRHTEFFVLLRGTPKMGSMWTKIESEYGNGNGYGNSKDSKAGRQIGRAHV